MRDQGLFIFTLFAHDAADFSAAASGKLAQSDCYAHSPAYVNRAAQDSGFSPLGLKQVTHEHGQMAIPSRVLSSRCAARFP